MPSGDVPKMDIFGEMDDDSGVRKKAQALTMRLKQGVVDMVSRRAIPMVSAPNRSNAAHAFVIQAEVGSKKTVQHLRAIAALTRKGQLVLLNGARGHSALSQVMGAFGGCDFDAAPDGALVDFNAIAIKNGAPFTLVGAEHCSVVHVVALRVARVDVRAVSSCCTVASAYLDSMADPEAYFWVHLGNKEEVNAAKQQAFKDLGCDSMLQKTASAGKAMSKKAKKKAQKALAKAKKKESEKKKK